MIVDDINTSKKIAALSPKALALFALLVPKFNSYGKMNGDPHYVKGECCRHVKWLDVKTIERCLAEISENTNVKWWVDDGGNHWIHSLHHEKHNSGLRKDRRGKDKLPSFPGESGPLRDNSGTNPGLFTEYSNPEEEGEGEEEGEREERESPGLHPLAELFNRLCVNLPRVTVVSPGRRKKIATRLETQPSLDWWAKVFEKMAASDFLHGKNDRGWVADFDWIIANDENSLKVESGKYDNRKPFRTTKPQVSAITDNDAWRLVLQVAEGKQLKLDEITRRAAEAVGWEKIKGDEMDRSLAQAKFFEVRRHILNKENETRSMR